MPEFPSRYEHRRLLGEGGMGRVFLVYDREREEEVALKTFAPPDDIPAAQRDEARFLFKQEFWAMASLSHPNLVAAYDYGELADGTPYLTMELVPGEDLPAGDAERPLQAHEDDVRGWLPGLAAALAFLHGRGFVHGDLKPENVRLRDDGRVKLMDLGLLDRSGRVGGPIRGSLLYVAPEVARQGAIDARSDLYALGAVLYHVLSGRPPFETDSPVALLRAHISQKPVPLRQHAPTLSREIESAVMRLLNKEPQERFASAAELLAALGLATGDMEAMGLLGSPLVGRDEVQAEIGRLLEGPGGGLLWLAGANGAGKSRLLAETRATAQLAGTTTFFAQGLGADGSPYQALRPWLKALTASPTPERDRLAPVLARLLPELGVEAAPPLDGAQERMRLHGAVAELARAVAPSAAWLLDDADAIDSASRDLLQFLQQQNQGQAWRWLLTTQVPPDQPATGRLGTGRILPLAPLDDNQVLAVASAMLGQDELPAALSERLPILTGGMPGLIEAVLGHWTRSGTLVRAEGRWIPAPDASFDLPGGVQVVLDSRFAELSTRAQAVGRTAALLGVMAELPWLAGLMQWPEAEFFAALAELEAADVLAREESAFRFVRPAQAAALAASWGLAEAQALHTLAARWMTAHLGADPEKAALPLGDVTAVARHHLSGDEPLDGIPWVLSSVRRSLGLFVSAGVEPLLRKALDVPGLHPAHQLTLEEQLGTVFRFAGQVDEALALYENSLLPRARERNTPDLAQHLVTHGVILQMKGRYPQALKVFAEAINLADATKDQEAGVRARLFAGRVAFFAGETGAARTHLASAIRRSREAGMLVALAGGLSLYGYILATSDAGRVAEGLALLDESVALNQDLGNMYEQHEAFNNQGNVYMSVGRLAEARGAFDACLELCQRMGMANEALFAHLNLGAVQLELGDLGASLAQARKASEMAKSQGRKFPEGFSSALEGLGLIYAGELGAGSEKLERGLALAREIKNKYLELNILVYRAEALLHLGRFAETESVLVKARELAEATQNDEQNTKLERLSYALAVLTHAPDAAEKLSAALESTRSKQQLVPLAHALRWQGDRLLRALDTDVARVLLGEALELAESSGLLMLSAEINLLLGQAALAINDSSALTRFDAGLQLAHGIGYRVVEIVCQAGTGAADPGQRLNRQEAPRRLEALMASLEPAERQDFLAWPERAAVMVSMASDNDGYSSDRLHHLTDLIAAVTAQPDLGAVMEQALAALVDIAGAERGFLLLYKGFEVSQQIFQGMNEDDSDAFSSSLAYQILWSGEPLFVEDAQTHAEFAQRQSVQSLELRSMVGVPLNDGQETLGVMLADSKRINTRFTPEDMDLAMALARQVAITITNARRLERYMNGYEELEILHRLSLEIIGETDLARIMLPVTLEAVKLCAADRALLLLGPELQFAGGFDQKGQAVSAEKLDISRSVGQWVFENGEPLHLLDAQSDESFQAKKSILTLGLRTIYAAPVSHNGQRLGVLYLDHTRMGEDNPAGLHTLARIGDLLGAFLVRSGLGA